MTLPNGGKSLGEAARSPERQHSDPASRLVDRYERASLDVFTMGFESPGNDARALSESTS